MALCLLGKLGEGDSLKHRALSGTDGDESIGLTWLEGHQTKCLSYVVRVLCLGLLPPSSGVSLFNGLAIPKQRSPQSHSRDELGWHL